MRTDPKICQWSIHAQSCACWQPTKNTFDTAQITERSIVQSNAESVPLASPNKSRYTPSAEIHHPCSSFLHILSGQKGCIIGQMEGMHASIYVLDLYEFLAVGPWKRDANIWARHFGRKCKMVRIRRIEDGSTLLFCINGLFFLIKGSQLGSSGSYAQGL